MARGWESKSIEAQQEEATRQRPKTAPLTFDQRLKREARRTLELARTRTIDEMARATSEAHREMLKAALMSLDEKLNDLGG